MIKINNKQNHYIFTSVLTLISLMLCRDWYIDTTRLFNIDFFNLFILAIFISMTFYQLYEWLALRNEVSNGTKISLLDNRDRMYNIEFLRVVFTIGVLTSHFFNKLGLCNFGWLGVMFFFMVSGFFLNLTFSPQKSVGAIVKKRICQFIPLIICGSFLHILFIHYISIPDMVAEFLLMTSTGLYTHARYNCVSWYISVLFWVSIFYFYLIKTKSKENVNIFLAIISFLGLIAMIKRGMAWQNTLGDKGDLGFVFDMRFVYGLATIAIGYFIAEIFKMINSDKIISSTEKTVYTLMEMFFICYNVLIMFIKPMYPRNIGIVAFCYASMILLFVLKRGYISQFLEKKIWAIPAKYCLATYLVQSITTLSIFDWAVKKYPLLLTEYKGFTIFATLFICITLGVWAHHVIEKPCGKFLKKVL